MNSKFDDVSNTVEISARSVLADGHMPDYVRLDLRVYPLNVNTVLTPADAKKLAMEIYAAACELDRQVELIAFELEPA